MQIKKYFMIVYWRTQQIASIFTMILMAFTVSLQVNLYIEWRFSNSYIGILLSLFILAVIILLAGYAWDKRLKMWREQVQVSIERNPYATKKLTPKEIITHESIVIPILEHMADNARDGPSRRRFAQSVIAYRRWIAHEKLDTETKKDSDELREWLNLDWSG